MTPRSSHRRLGALMRKTVLGLAVLAGITGPVAFASPATAAPDGSLRGLLLSGTETCGGYKTVYGKPQTPYLFGPVQLLGEDFMPIGRWLIPYEVRVISGEEEELKARHLVPGVTYTRPGQQAANPVTCDFTGASKDVGSFEVQITGLIHGQ